MIVRAMLMVLVLVMVGRDHGRSQNCDRGFVALLDLLAIVISMAFVP